jgi:hypothetical protein
MLHRTNGDGGGPNLYSLMDRLQTIVDDALTRLFCRIRQTYYVQTIHVWEVTLSLAVPGTDMTNVSSAYRHKRRVTNDRYRLGGIARMRPEALHCGAAAS